MRTSLLATLVSVSFLTLAVPVHAQDASARQIIDKAIQASGGEARLSQWKGAAWGSRGTFHALETTLPFSGAWALQWPDKAHIVFHVEAAGMRVNYNLVLNGDKGWIKVNNGEPIALDKERLAEQQEALYLDLVSRLLVLKDAACTLTTLPETKLADRPVAGVQVAHKGHRDIQLFFDKDSGLLLKTVMRVKTDQGGEVNQETLYSDYRPLKDEKDDKNPKKEKAEKVNPNDIKIAMKVAILRDGKPYVESDLYDFKPSDKPLDPKLFEKP